MISVVLVLFDYFSLAGLHGFGEMSAFLSLTSRWMSPAIMVFCWPDRQWVREKIAAINSELSSERGFVGRPVLSPETRVAPGLQPL
jgi:hypothetical protein